MVMINSADVNLTYRKVKGTDYLYIFMLKLFLIGSLIFSVHIARSQDTTSVRGDSIPTLENTMEAGDEQEVVEPRRKLIRWNEYEGPYFSVRVGGGFLYDGATYIQDPESKKQVTDLDSEIKLRDLRMVFKGRFGPKNMKHAVTYSMGIMYDDPNKKLLFRETGIMVAIPELWGNFFIGRTKEGFSLNKVMVGYAGWTMERSTMSDATVPILGDGIKWLGYLPNHKILWNIGYFFDKFNYDQAFSSYDHQGVARIMWLPVLSEEKRTLFHLGANLRLGSVDNDTLQLRSRPEAWPAPYFVDTKKMYVTSTFMYGGEVYYRKGPWLIGSEYWFQQTKSPENQNPLFHGGEIVTTWMITGETREYNTVGGFFKGILPERSVFKGGPGAWEAVLRFSYIDLSDGKVTGGRFNRITPMINWHLSDYVRFEFGYGYGVLHKNGLHGGTQFFQTRIQLQL
jgi:phosphate-selective porin OprO and OprP